MATSSDDDTQLDPVVETIPGIAALVVLAVLSLVVMTRTCILRQRLRLRVQSATLEAKENEKERPKLHEVCCEEAGSALEKSAMVGWTRIMVRECSLSRPHQLMLSRVPRTSSQYLARVPSNHRPQQQLQGNQRSHTHTHSHPIHFASDLSGSMDHAIIHCYLLPPILVLRAMQIHTLRQDAPPGLQSCLLHIPPRQTPVLR